jgi:hypothetical protein
MEQKKSWYTSRTIWASIVTFAALVAAAFGLPVDDVEQQALVDALLQAAAAVGALVAIVGRLVARSRIG